MYIAYDGFFEDGVPFNCKRKIFVEEANKSNQRIEVIPLDKFLSILGTSEEELNKMPLPSIECFLREDALIKAKKI